MQVHRLVGMCLYSARGEGGSSSIATLGQWKESWKALHDKQPCDWYPAEATGTGEWIE